MILNFFLHAENSVDHASNAVHDGPKQAKEKAISDNKVAKGVQKASLTNAPADIPIALAVGVPASVAAAAAIPHTYIPAAKNIEADDKPVAEADSKPVGKANKNSVETDANTVAETDNKSETKAAGEVPTSKDDASEPAAAAVVLETDLSNPAVAENAASKPATKPVVVAPAAVGPEVKADLNHPATDFTSKPAIQPVTDASTKAAKLAVVPAVVPAVDKPVLITPAAPVIVPNGDGTPKNVPAKEATDSSPAVVAEVPIAVAASDPVSSVDSAVHAPITPVSDTKDVSAESSVAEKEHRPQVNNVVAAPLVPVTTITPSIEPTPTATFPSTGVSSPFASSTAVSSSPPITRSSLSSPSSMAPGMSTTRSMNRTSTTAAASSTTTIPPMSMGVSMYDSNNHLLGFAVITFLFMIYEA